MNEREHSKEIRYSGGRLVPAVGCKHTAATSFCHAAELTPEDMVMNFRRFYDDPDKVEQDRVLLHLMTITGVKRHRRKIKDKHKRRDRNFSMKYNLFCNDPLHKVPTFLTVLGEYNFHFRIISIPQLGVGREPNGFLK